MEARNRLALGALTPGLPPVEMDGHWEWDGGLVANTPLEHVVAAADEDMLVFRVDLFPARGERPHDLEQAWSREKDIRSEEHTSELQSLMRISYAVFCLKKKKTRNKHNKKQLIASRIKFIKKQYTNTYRNTTFN